MPHPRLPACLAAAVAALAAVLPSTPLAAEPPAEAAAVAAVGPAAAVPPEAVGVVAPAEATPVATGGDAAPAEATPTAHEGGAPLASPQRDGAVPGARRIQVPVPAAATQRIDWYRPAPLADADAKLPWNRSVLGGFDPWTKQKVTFLFQHHGLALSLPGAEGLNEYGDDELGEEEEPIAYPSSRFSATYPGVRVEVGNWSLALATASGRVRWDAGEETGPGFEMRATTYEAIIARGFGALALFDGGSGDFRIGLSWPEIYLRLVYGNFSPEVLDGRDLGFGILGAGVSLLGVRMTVGDTIFAELRAGDLSFHQAVSYVDLGLDDLGEELDKDILLQSRAGFELRPMLRIGFAL